MPGTPRKLDGWKEIAAYLNRDVTTVIRWEHERGLPVQRLPGGKRGAVLAYRDEIDAWLTSEPRARRPLGRDDRRADGHRREAVNGGVSAAAPPAESPARRPVTRYRQLAAAGLGLIAAVIALASLRAGGRGGAAIHRIEFERSAVVARDEMGNDLWRHVSFAPIDVEWTRRHPTGRYVLVDLEGDGEVEAVVNVTRASTHEALGDELVSFSASGKVRWRQRLDETIQFRGGAFGPPWSLGHVGALAVDGETRIAWVLNSPPSWPAVLSVLDRNGRQLSRFVHSGSIYALATSWVGRRPLILAGGVSNANRAAGLVVLDGRSASGHSREPAGSPYECLRCPVGDPLQYLLLPPGEINAAIGRPYNSVVTIQASPEGFDVRTLESDIADENPVMRHYVLSPDLRLERSYPDDNAWPYHERLEREGRLSHSVADCTMFRRAPMARVWDSTRGWRSLEVAVGAAITVGPKAAAPPR
jgi:hypothetical protein